jgi:hypothetical protein
MSARSKVVGALAAVVLASLAAWSIAPQRDGPIRLRVQASVAQHDVARIGVNLGTWTSWGAEQLSSNVLMNPGFNSTIDRAIVIVSHADKAGFEDDQTWLARPDGFWTNAEYDVRSGADAGRHGMLTGSRSKGRDGMPRYETDDAPAHLAPGDVVAITREHGDAGPPANWWIAGTSVGRVAIDLIERAPAGEGTGALDLKYGAGSPAEVSSYLDAITDRAGKLLPVNGRWRLRFWSRADTTAASLRITFGRIGAAPFIDRAIEPSRIWQLTSIDFTGHDDEAPAAMLELRFSAGGSGAGRILIDDVGLRAASPTDIAFRAEAIDVLRVLHPGYLRDWQGQLGDTLANRLAPDFARHPTRYRPGDETQFSYSLPDFLDLCRRVGARPWVVVPVTFSDAELVGLGKYLAAQNASYRFDEIALEFGNENWNGIFRPAAIPDPATYGAVADRAFRLIREGAGPGPHLRMVVGGQYANPDLSARVIAHAPAADTLAIAPYFLYSLTAGMTDGQRLAALFEVPAVNLPGSARAAAHSNKSLAVYEVNLHTTGGDAPESDRNSLVAGAAAGTALAWRIIQALDAGAGVQMAYVLAGFDASMESRRSFVRLWGITRDLAAAPRLRPTGLAIELLNQAIGGDFHGVSSTSTKISSAAFLDQRQWSAVVASSADAPLAVSIEFPAGPAGQLPQRLIRLESKSPFSTNETQIEVRLENSAVALDGHSINLVMPPYGLVALVSADRAGGQL